jgi:hypothetical protein
MPRDRGVKRGHLDRLPNEDTVERLVTFLKLGNYMTVAAAMCGLDNTQCAHWLREGIQEDGRPWAKEFHRKVTNAKAYAQAAALQVVRDAALNGDWRASAWYLSRVAPDQWGAQSRVELTVSAASPQSSREKLLEALDALGDEFADDFIDVGLHDDAVAARAAGEDDTGAAESEAGRPAGFPHPGSPERGVVVRRTA